MSTWRQSRTALAKKHERDTLPLHAFIAQVHTKARVAGTAVYMTSRTDMVPVPLLHNLKHNKVLHQRIVLLHIITEKIPRVRLEKRIELLNLGDNFHSMVAHYGFMQSSWPRASCWRGTAASRS
jgi:KUP system potassium uptake protein